MPATATCCSATFLATSRYTASATSFGGLRSTADRRERWGDAVVPGLVRFSAGCEDTGDLVYDVMTALDAGYSGADAPARQVMFGGSDRN